MRPCDGHPGFVRFLPSNEALAPLEPKDQELLSHFLSFGEIVQKSAAYFDENKRIRVISGPLKNLEGLIVRVDRRKGRARVGWRCTRIPSRWISASRRWIRRAAAPPKD